MRARSSRVRARALDGPDVRRVAQCREPLAAADGFDVVADDTLGRGQLRRLRACACDEAREQKKERGRFNEHGLHARRWARVPEEGLRVGHCFKTRESGENFDLLRKTFEARKTSPG